MSSMSHSPSPWTVDGFLERVDERLGVRRVGHHDEVAGRRPPHDQVVDDVRVVGIEQMRVLRPSRPDAIEVVGERPLQRGERPGAAHVHRTEVRHVEHDRVLTTRSVLLEHAGVLDGHLPSAERHHARTKSPVLRVEWRVPHADSCADSWALCGPTPPPGVGEQVELGGTLGAVGELRRRFEAVLHQQLEVVALVQDLDLDLRVQLHQAACLPVLLGDQLLVERGDLDVEVVRREVEVGRERLRRVALAVALEHERARLVLPVDRVEVEQLRELSFGVVREADLLMGQRLRRDGQPPDAARGSEAVRSSATCSRTSASSSSIMCASGTMLSTP